MALAGILKADYADLIEDEAAGIPDFTIQQNSTPTSPTSNPTCAKPPKNSSSKKPPSSATPSRDLRTKEFFFS